MTETTSTAGLSRLAEHPTEDDGFGATGGQSAALIAVAEATHMPMFFTDDHAPGDPIIFANDDVGIGTDGEEHSLALDAVLHAPEFAAARRHKEENALPVSQFSGLAG